MEEFDKWYRAAFIGDVEDEKGKVEVLHSLGFPLIVQGKGLGVRLALLMLACTYDINMITACPCR